MPYEWTEPDLFLEFEDVAVYHCYDDGGELCWYWYTTDPSDDNVDWSPAESAQFDVRDLPNLGLDANDTKNHTAIIQHAIREGLITGEPAITEEALVVKIEVLGGAAHIVEKPPNIEVEIIDRDVECIADEEDE